MKDLFITTNSAAQEYRKKFMDAEITLKEYRNLLLNAGLTVSETLTEVQSSAKERADKIGKAK